VQLGVAGEFMVPMVPLINHAAIDPELVVGALQRLQQEIPVS
jgi:hypothetical protein